MGGRSYLVGTDDQTGDPSFIQPLQNFTHGGSGLIASLVGKAAGLGLATSPVFFEGGNTLVGDTFYFVGVDYLHDTLHAIAKNKVLTDARGTLSTEISARVRTQFVDRGRKVHFIGCKETLPAQTEAKIRICKDDEEVTATEQIHRGTRKGSFQPLFHLDMFVTLVGREPDNRFRVLVGDPRMAAEILETPLPTHATPDAFDEIADRLSAHEEFVVQRSPLPYIYLDCLDPGPENSKVYTRYWYFATANNCLVQNDDQDRHVWLPSYGYGAWKHLQATDERNEEIWRAMGFKVTMLPNFQAFAVNLGALHCLKKYLER